MFTIRAACNGILFLFLAATLSACGGGKGGNGGAPLNPQTQSNTTSSAINLKGGSIQTGALSLNNNVTTYAGLIPDTDGDVLNATLSSPVGIVSLATTNGTFLYIVDSNNEVIRQYDNATGTLTTIAGTGNAGFADSTSSGRDAQFNDPQGITTDGTNLYVADSGNNAIRKIELSDGKYLVSTVTGGGINSVLKSPAGVTTDGTNLYVADSGNNRIVSIAISSGTVTQLAGSSSFTAGGADSTDGTGATATFWYPAGIYYEQNNNVLYVADMNNNLIRKVDPSTGQTITIAGTGTAGTLDDTGTAAQFDYPMGLTANSTGTILYVVDTNSYYIRQIDLSTMAVTTLSGNAAQPGTISHSGTTLSTATYYRPEGIAVDPNDDTKLYVTDTNSNTIRQLNLGSTNVSTLTGISSLSLQDGVGTSSLFHTPNGVTTDGTNLYVADTASNTIRKIVIASAVTNTLAGSLSGTKGNSDGQGSSASFNGPFAITTDGTYLYVADSYNQEIRRIEIDNGMVQTIAGSSKSSYSNDSTGTNAGFNLPFGVTYAKGNLYIADAYNNVIRKLNLTSDAVTTFAGAAPDGSGNAAAPGSTDSTSASAASFNWPHGITTDGTNLYVADTGNNLIRQISIATGAVTTLAGNGTAGEVDNTKGTQAEFDSPTGITTDGTYLYVTDTNAIREVDISSGAVSTIAGALNQGHTDGNGAQAHFSSPQSITTDGISLYVCDTNNSTIRKIQ